jgi:hypothetical protein
MSTLTRTEIAVHVGGAFTKDGASRADLLANAVQKNARPCLLDKLQELPEGQHFRTVRDLWVHIPEVPVE